MAKKARTGTGAGSDPRTAADSKAARDEYVDDFMQRSKTVAEHNDTLKERAPARIKQASKAVKAATKAAPAKSDDSLTRYHAVERMLQEKAFYPPHDKRTESPAYAKVHKQMTVAEDQPCLVCGVRHSTLGDKKQNPFGAVQMETHHHIIEWALANAVVPDLFNSRVRPGMLARATQRKAKGDKDPIFNEFDPLYAKDMSKDQITAWVDHSPDNLWVLCDVHHRHKFVGIHAISYPVWGPQDLLDATIVQDEIDSLGKTIAKERKAKKPA